MPRSLWSALTRNWKTYWNQRPQGRTERQGVRRLRGLSFQPLEQRTMLAVLPELVRDIFPGGSAGNPSQFTEVNGTLYFQATDGTNGIELWKSDGTSAGTVLVKDIRPGAGNASPISLTNVNGTLYFQATDGSKGYELWKSDGTSAGTVLVKDIRPGASNANPISLTNVNGTLYFQASDGSTGVELWKSNGTSAGTVLVKDIRPGTFNASPRYLTNVNGTLYFQATDGSNGYELWKSDGSSSGTVLVKDIALGSNSAGTRYLTNVNGTLYFRASDFITGVELWRSDGTSARTGQVRDIRPGANNNSFPRYLTNVNGTLYFRADDGSTGYELWKSDGSNAGTVLVKDIRPGVSGASLGSLTNVNGTLYFRADDGSTGVELWKSDGTSAGTVLVKDIHPGATGASLGSLTNVNGTLYFQATDGSTGVELWKSDGTSAGTVLVKDILPGAGDASLGSLTNVNGTLFFRADDGTNGSELWKLAGSTAAVNLAPTNTVPAAQTINEDTALLISGISISDADAGTLNVSVTLSVASGTLNVITNAVGGVTSGAISGNGGASVTITAPLAAINATLSSASGVTYQGTLNYNGSDLLTLLTNDLGNTGTGGALTDGDTVAITVTEFNDAPTGTNDTLSNIAEDSGNYTIPFATLLGNDSTGPANESGQVLTITAVGSAVGGTVSIVGSDVIFSPAANFNGAASLVYTLSDDGTTGGSSDPLTGSATAGFTITEVNDAPSGTNDTLSNIAEDSSNYTIPFATLLGNDSKGPANESGQTLTITSVGSAVGGTVSIVGSDLIFSPAANFNGAASFVYTLSDDGTTGGSSDPLTGSATASFTITEVNDAPSGTNDTLSNIAEDSGNYTIPFATLLGNDSTGPANESGQVLTITAVGSAVGGSVSIVGSDVIFSPTLNFNGAASFVYTLRDNGTTNGGNDFKTGTATASFTITEVNDSPNAVTNVVPFYIGPGTRTISQASLLANDTPGPANESS